MSEISRKDFLKGMGKTVAGVTVVGSLGTVLAGCSTPAATVEAAEKPQHPFTYVKVDPDKAAEKAYKGYKEKGG